MKFTVASSELQKALNKISGVVPSKSTLPILENILFDLSKNTLRLAATDLEVFQSKESEASLQDDGRPRIQRHSRLRLVGELYANEGKAFTGSTR